MDISFPAAPREGQIWPPQGGTQFRYGRRSGWTPIIRGVASSCKRLSDVRWVWVKHSQINNDGIPLGQMDAGQVGFNPATGELTSGANVGIPAPIAFDGVTLPAGNTASLGTSNSAVASSFFSGTQPIGLAVDVADGLQVGDRIYFGDLNYWGMQGVYTIEDLGQAGVRPWRLKLVPELMPLEELKTPYLVKTKQNFTGFDKVSGITILHENFWSGSYASPGFQYMYSSDSIAVEPLADETCIVGSYNCISVGGVVGGGSYECVVSHPANTLISCRRYNATKPIGAIVGVDNNNTRGFVGSRKVTVVAGASYTADEFDMGRVVYTSSGSAVTVNLPTEATAGRWIPGATLRFIQGGSGAITVTPAVGVTLQGLATTSGVGQVRELLYLGGNSWVCTGGAVPLPTPAQIGAPATDPTGITGASTVTNIVRLSQANYDAIGTPNASTLYIIEA